MFLYIDQMTGVIGFLADISVFDSDDVPANISDLSDSEIAQWVEDNQNIAAAIYPMYRDRHGE